MTSSLNAFETDRVRAINGEFNTFNVILLCRWITEEAAEQINMVKINKSLALVKFFFPFLSLFCTLC